MGDVVERPLRPDGVALSGESGRVVRVQLPANSVHQVEPCGTAVSPSPPSGLLRHPDVQEGPGLVVLPVEPERQAVFGIHASPVPLTDVFAGESLP